MTEDEARYKWCPMARVPVPFPDGVVACNKEYDTDNTTKCMASDCMMWKWKISPEDSAIANAQADVGLSADGYCGLIK